MSFLQYLKTKIVLIICLIIGGCVMTFFVCDICSTSFSWFVKVASFTTAIWLSMWLGNEYMSHFLDQKISWTKEPIRRFGVGIAGMLIYTVVVVFILVMVFEKGFQVYVGGPINMLYGSVSITFIITLFMTSRVFLLNWKQAAIDSERLQKESITAQYNSLKSQVNPHFLFNSLNALTNLVYEDQDKAVKFIKQLSEVYRYVLDTQSKEVVPLKEELEFLDSYIFLQKIRFGDNLSIEVDLARAHSMVAPLALQLLIENAIKHNIVSSENPLVIKLMQQQKFIVVENCLQRKTSLGEPSQGIGLENIKNRYKFLSPIPVEVREADGKFIVKLPLIEVE